MIYVWGILGIIATLLIFTIGQTLYQNYQVSKRIKREFGLKPDYYGNRFDFDAVKEYHTYVNRDKIIDDTTWNDLDMDAVYLNINNTQSCVGEAYLYAHLRNQKENDLVQFERDVNGFDHDEATRLETQKALNLIGKQSVNGLLQFLTHPQKIQLGDRVVLPLMRAIAIIGLVLLFIDPATAAFIITFSFLINFGLNSKVTKMADREMGAMSIFIGMIKSGRKIIANNYGIAEPTISSMKHNLSAFNGVNAIFSFAIPTSGSSMGENMFADLLNAYFLIPPLAFNAIVRRVENNNQEAMKLYADLGYLETAIATASYRHTLGTHCRWTQSDVLAPDVRDVAHPLLDTPVPNSVPLPQYNIITGSNASGKSTFVRAVAINAILAQTINTCTAAEFSMKPSYVITSMAISDDVESGDSYFVSETKSIKRIIEQVQQNDHSLIVIDEILKGTNTIERIAASASILDELTDHPCTVLAATHDIELTEMLGSKYANYHFRETITEEGISFNFKINEGPSTTRNAIKLLEYIGYPERLVKRAYDLANVFDDKRTWPQL